VMTDTKNKKAAKWMSLCCSVGYKWISVLYNEF